MAWTVHGMDCAWHGLVVAWTVFGMDCVWHGLCVAWTLRGICFAHEKTCNNEGWCARKPRDRFLKGTLLVSHIIEGFTLQAGSGPSAASANTFTMRVRLPVVSQSPYFTAFLHRHL